MRLIDKIIEVTGKTEEECYNDCPFNHYDEIALPTGFTALCNDNGEDCETCLDQLIHDERLISVLLEKLLERTDEDIDKMG